MKLIVVLPSIIRSYTKPKKFKYSESLRKRSNICRISEIFGKKRNLLPLVKFIFYLELYIQYCLASSYI